MLKIFTYAIFCLFFIGCSNKELSRVKELPYYNKEKVNLYLIYNQTVLSNQVEFTYTIKSDNFNKKINVCLF